MCNKIFALSHRVGPSYPDLVRLIEVGVHFLQKLRHLSCLLTNLTELWWTFDHSLGHKSIKFLVKSILIWQRKCVSDAVLKGIHAKLNYKDEVLSYPVARGSEC